MSKVRSPKGKVSLAGLLSLGSLILGIACIFWALINIRAQSGHLSETYQYPSRSPTALGVRQFGLTDDSALASSPPLDTPNPGDPLYPSYPSEGDNIGSLSIPVLEEKLPIIQGTSAEELKRGVGHFTQSVLPGEEDNCVLSGHRDTVFANLGELKIGDHLIVQTSAGAYTYKINGIRIVDKDDRTVIVPADHAVLTLSTCYPFHFVGNAPDRYILTADLVIDE